MNGNWLSLRKVDRLRIVAADTVRISAFFLSAAFCLALAPGLRAQNPGAQQDAEAAREKLLKASDELDNIQANSETTRLAVDGMKTDVASLQQTVTKLQSDNDALKQQLATMQAAFDEYKTEQAKERQALIDSVAGMIASGKSSRKKKETAPSSAEAPPAEPSSEVHSTMQTTAPSLAPPPDDSASASTQDAPPTPKKEKGYYHVVASGETVPMIAAAFRDQGVKVTSSQIRKANGLTPDSVLKPGEKLFIPKPGT
jgi:LysM repeat protein